MGSDLPKSLEGDRTPGEARSGGTGHDFNVCPGSKGGSMGSHGGDIKQRTSPSGEVSAWRASQGHDTGAYVLGSKGYRPGLKGK